MKSSRKDMLIENYEDATFALLMDNMMEADGKKWLEENERLKDDPNFLLPEGMDERCLRLIQRKQSEQKRKIAFRKARVVVSRVAMIFFVLAILFTIPFCTVSAFRASVMNLIIETFDEGTSIRIGTGSTQSITPSFSIGPTWLPEGFSLTDSMSDNSSFFQQYTDTHNHEIYYEEDVSSVGGVIDTENAEKTEEIKISGNKALVSIKNDTIILVWTDTARDLVCSLTTVGIDETTAIKIAESIGK